MGRLLPSIELDQVAAELCTKPRAMVCRSTTSLFPCASASTLSRTFPVCVSRWATQGQGHPLCHRRALPLTARFMCGMAICTCSHPHHVPPCALGTLQDGLGLDHWLLLAASSHSPRHWGLVPSEGHLLYPRWVSLIWGRALSRYASGSRPEPSHHVSAPCVECGRPWPWPRLRALWTAPGSCFSRFFASSSLLLPQFSRMVDISRKASRH